MNRSIRFLPRRATALAAALLGCWGAAQAAATAEQLGTIKLYGDVTIAQDRVDRWGPWEEFEPPAAGPLGFVAANLQFQREPYRPLPTPEDPDPVPPEVVARLCEAGSLCGYGTQGVISGEVGSTSTTLQMITLERGSAENEDGSPPTPSLSIRLDQLPSGTTESLSMLAKLEGADGTFYGVPGDPRTSALVMLPVEDADYVVDEVPNFFLSTYVEGNGPRQLVGVVGRVTGTGAMTALRVEGQQASYRGWDFHQQSGQMGSVSIDVNFGSGTFTYATEGGVQSYQAQGVIRGSGYVATSFGTANTSGTLQGNFIGSNANGTVGGASVTQNGVTANTIHATRRVIEEVPR
ncbi:MAG: hypothetical protein MK041_04495 [Aquabacterium sp.]|nr:hypothetical protein [Aquabacterium sp.]